MDNKGDDNVTDKMTAKRFVNAGEEDIISHNNLHYAESGYKMIDNSDNASYCIFDTKENVDFLCMKLNNQQKQADKNWKIVELIIEYDTTNKYSKEDVIHQIKEILGLVMI